MSLEYRIGDVFDRMAEIPDGSIDLIVTSPPFLALRSYLPADHPDKAKEIGSEATPADFLDTLLALSAEWGRVLAPHGSLCVELGDTYSGGSVGWDTDDAKWTNRNGFRTKTAKDGLGWPLAKSLTGIPTLYTWSLAYGRNLLTGVPTDDPPWRIRNVIVWARPNPPVGALGDKFRPATSYITVACRGAKRYFDLDAVRGPGSPNTHARLAQGADARPTNGKKADNPNNNYGSMLEVETAGAPPLDWHTDHHPEDGDWLWKMATAPYKGAHYASYPYALPKRLIEAMCPLRVCTVCGRPSERIVDHKRTMLGAVDPEWQKARSAVSGAGAFAQSVDVTRETLGWSDCGCVNKWNCRVYHPECGELNCPCPPDNYEDRQETRWRTGVVLDPFAGSGTTLEAAQAVGRYAIGIDLDHRNADLARSRVGMFLDVEGAA
jgi:site-specific DNA-methyltransferase (adenine-specific)